MADIITLREPSVEDEAIFLSTMNKSQELHFPFITAPKTSEEFTNYLEKNKKESENYFIACTKDNKIIGVFNISGIMQGVFKSAYPGYYASVDFAGSGLMSKSLK